MSVEVATHEEHMAVCLPTYNTFMKEEEGRNNALKSVTDSLKRKRETHMDH